MNYGGNISTLFPFSSTSTQVCISAWIQTWVSVLPGLVISLQLSSGQHARKWHFQNSMIAWFPREKYKCHLQSEPSFCSIWSTNHLQMPWSLGVSAVQTSVQHFLAAIQVGCRLKDLTLSKTSVQGDHISLQLLLDLILFALRYQISQVLIFWFLSEVYICLW